MAPKDPISSSILFLDTLVDLISREILIFCFIYLICFAATLVKV